MVMGEFFCLFVFFSELNEVPRAKFVGTDRVTESREIFPRPEIAGTESGNYGATKSRFRKRETKRSGALIRQ